MESEKSKCVRLQQKVTELENKVILLKINFFSFIVVCGGFECI